MDDYAYLLSFLGDNGSEEKTDPKPEEGKGNGLDLTNPPEVKPTGSRILDKIPSVDDLPSVPGGGDLGALIVLILVLVFAIMPAGNGKSRLMLLWDAVMGRLTFAPQDSADQNSPASALLPPGMPAAGTITGTVQSIIPPIPKRGTMSGTISNLYGIH